MDNNLKEKELNEIDHILNFYYTLVNMNNSASKEGLDKDEEYLKWRNDILESLLNDSEDLEEDLNDFDDSEILELIEDYKSTVEALDDFVFMDSLDEMKTIIDINKFDDLLELKHFNEEEASELQKMINISSEIISKNLNSHIQAMFKAYQKLN